MKTLAFSAVFSMSLLCASQGLCLSIINADTLFFHAWDNASMPADAVMKGDGSFAVLDAVKGDITVYKNYLETRKYTGTGFRGAGCLVGSGGGYYLCDAPNGRLRVLDAGFNPGFEIKLDKFDPTDAVEYGDELYIADNDNHRIAVWNKNSREITSFIGERGRNLGQFNYPFSLAADGEGFLFVSEVINARVQMINRSLKGVLAIGSWGVKSGELYRPKGVAVYRNKYLIVSDGYIGALQVFTLEGKFVGVIGDEKGGVRRYASPTRIRAAGNELAVVDPWSRSVEIINLEGLE